MASEAPMLFSGAMVHALLDERKTQTRRILAKQPPFEVRGGQPTGVRNVWVLHGGDLQTAAAKCPRAVGDIIWVKEKYRLGRGFDKQRPGLYDPSLPVYYPGDSDEPPPEPPLGAWVFGKLRPAIHMPRALSRIRRRVSKIRVETLQRISDADAIAEGICRSPEGLWSRDAHLRVLYERPAMAYCDLWCEINGRASWNANPAVWVYELEKVDGE